MTPNTPSTDDPEVLARRFLEDYGSEIAYSLTDDGCVSRDALEALTKLLGRAAAPSPQAPTPDELHNAIARIVFDSFCRSYSPLMKREAEFDELHYMSGHKLVLVSRRRNSKAVRTTTAG